MTFAALDSNDKVQENWTVYSIGGGALAKNNDNPTIESPDVYGMENMTDDVFLLIPFLFSEVQIYNNTDNCHYNPGK